MRVGLIGLGRIGAFHAETLAGLSAVDELVVTDVVPAAVDAVVERFDGLSGRARAVPAADADAVLGSGPDAVVIASPTPLHLPLLRRALAAGVPTFCEKPVAEDPYRAAGLPAEVEAAGVPVQVGFPRRFDPAFLAAKAALDAGELGTLTIVRSTTMDPAPPPAAYLRSSGGIFRDCAIHDLDAVGWVTGRRVVQVVAVGTNRGIDPALTEVFAEVDDVDTASALLTFDDGTLGVISNTRFNGQGHDVRLELHGSAGSIAAGLDDGLPMRSAQPGVSFPPGPPHTFFMDRFATAFRAELAAFCEVAAGRRPSPCTVAEALEASWLAEACTRSRVEGRPVSLAEIRPRSD